jgi:hypothetical protein
MTGFPVQIGTAPGTQASTVRAADPRHGDFKHQRLTNERTEVKDGMVWIDVHDIVVTPGSTETTDGVKRRAQRQVIRFQATEALGNSGRGGTYPEADPSHHLLNGHLDNDVPRETNVTIHRQGQIRRSHPKLDFGSAKPTQIERKHRR